MCLQDPENSTQYTQIRNKSNPYFFWVHNTKGQYLQRANKSPIKINGLFRRDPFPFYTHYFLLATAHGLNLLMK